jgi:hypothetical protein
MAVAARDPFLALDVRQLVHEQPVLVPPEELVDDRAEPIWRVRRERLAAGNEDLRRVLEAISGVLPSATPESIVTPCGSQSRAAGRGRRLR